MKLSLALSALLIGGSLFMSGCNSSSSDVEKIVQEVVDNIDENVTDTINELTAPKFSTQMLAGKTFYSYGYGLDNGNFDTENRFKAIVSADASAMEIWASDGSEKYGDANSEIITDSKGRSAIAWHIDGITDSQFILLKIFDDGSFMSQPIDPDHFEAYPQLFAASQMEDKGLALYNIFFAEQIISKDILGANPWYSLDWDEVKRDEDGLTGDVNCHAVFTFDSDNTLDASYIDDSAVSQSKVDIGTYVISDNKLVMTTPDGEDGEMSTDTSTPLMVSKDTIIFNNKSALFKNRDDAITFVNLISGTSDGGCASKNFPE